MVDRPILFSAPMVCAILREIEQPGTGKTQTRGVLPNIEAIDDGDFHIFNGGGGLFGVAEADVPRAALDFVRFDVGDRLWVRESLSVASNDQGARWLAYAADGKDVWPQTLWHKDRNSVPSIHMPRWASRITLTVTEVRVQRLQEISEADALAEGVNPLDSELQSYRAESDGDGRIVSSQERRTRIPAFRRLWDSINADRAPWDSNPWVVAVTFTPAPGNIDQSRSAAC